jgi:hypothetical protein
MGEIRVKTKDGKTSTANGRYFVDNSGNFLGEYFLDDEGNCINRMKLPKGVIEAGSQPPSARHIWDAKTEQWSDPGPSAKELQREAEEAEKAECKAAAIQKLEGMGIGVDELKDALS